MTASGAQGAISEQESATTRDVALVGSAHVVMEGAGVPVRRVLPSRQVPYRLVDPFLLLDEFKLESFGGESFPPHPHRGFEIVTYMIRGTGQHSDSEGNQGEVRAGGLQRITAGRGIWHGEGGGSGAAGPVHGLQLWINLARAQKQIPPGYQGVQPEEIPERPVGDARVRVLVGEGSPTRLHTTATYLDVRLPAGGRTEITLPAHFQGFVYVLEGSGAFGHSQQTIEATQIGALAAGGPLVAAAGPEGAWFVVAAGHPHREPVTFNGPYVD